MTVANTNIAGREGTAFARFLDGLARMMERHPHARQIDRLNRMSDDDLAARGLTRQDVLRHIFRGRYYV